jgi:glycosyltransferase involved in cell wall biosynthesis
MKIGIDARLYGPEHGGIGRYAQKVIENLEKLNSQNDYVVFLASDGYEAYQPQNPRFTKVLADFRAYSLQEQLSFPFLLNKYKLDLTYFTHFNAPIFYSGRYVLTIHDLIISHFPDSRATTLPLWLYRVKLVFYNLAVRRVARKAERIIAISEFTKQDIVK